jgi:putative phage-type endonuclease
MQQNTPEWLEFRKNKIGASDAPIIMGLSPWKTRYRLWQEKLGLIETEAMNCSMKRGHDLEEMAREKYEEVTGNIILPEVGIHKDYEWMMASLDGISIERDIIVEIKCPGHTDHEVALNGSIPEKYWPQLQHQLAVYDLDVLHYFSFRHEDYALIEVHRDDFYIEKLIKEELRFWSQLQGMVPPELTDKDFSRRQDDEWYTLSKRWKEAKYTLQQAEELEKKCRDDLIKASHGQSTLGCDVRVCKYFKKGVVDYSSIPAIKNLDLSQFRKAST